MNILQIQNSDRIKLNSILDRIARWNSTSNIDMFVISQNSISVKQADNNPGIKSLYDQMGEILNSIAIDLQKYHDNEKPTTFSRVYTFPNECKITLDYTRETDYLSVKVSGDKGYILQSYLITEDNGLNDVATVFNDISQMDAKTFSQKYNQMKGPSNDSDLNSDIRKQTPNSQEY